MLLGALHLLVWLQQLLKLVEVFWLMPATLGASQLPSGGQFLPIILITTSFAFGERGVWAPIRLTHHLDIIGLRRRLMMVHKFWLFHHLFILNAELVIKRWGDYRAIRALSISHSVFTILASITYAAVGAGYAALITLAVFFQASRFLAMTTLRVVASVFLDLWLESMWVALHNRLHNL
jgi:hypothetical protein